MLSIFASKLRFMFGKGMMKKLEQMQQQVEETKGRLDNIKLVGEAMEGKVRVEVNGNGVITDISVKSEMSQVELTDLIMVAANRALEQANRTKEMEMAQSAKGIIPGM
ncbi:MAG: YbaB/EbfC family nucleoid-associated protein [Putridiphycobacter sp.]|nr:YbaB/EbfC family nucleoid-associated protein [Putridiphycobacter sp.]